MKRCPTCSRTFTDPNLSFCVDDGTPLTTEEGEDAAPYRPPTSYVPPSRKRRVWPWLLGIVAAFILGVAGLMIAMAIFVPRMVRPVVTSNVNTDNANVSDPVENVDAPPPTNEEQVLAQLRDLENEWTVANVNADKRKLGQILADEYVDQSGEGGTLQGKTEYINKIERDTQIEKWEFDDLKVRLTGDRATLTGKIKYFGNGREIEFDFTDKFVWRNGRWQATGSDVKRRE
jgi:Domain of unknown function (DUF4440)